MPVTSMHFFFNSLKLFIYYWIISNLSEIEIVVCIINICIVIRTTIAVINLIIFKYMHLKKYYSNEIFMQPGGINI